MIGVRLETWMMLAGLGLACLVGGCTAAASECERDGDCPAGEYCVSGGGVFVSGGRCVPESTVDDANANTGSDAAEPDASGRDGDDGEAPEVDGSAPDGCVVEPESCNGRDNDCDGRVDEGVTRDCPKSEGVCSGAAVACEGGSFPSSCAEAYGEHYETDESSCDGRDNDCDGETDEGCECQPGTTQACGSDRPGICEQGTQTCTDEKQWGPCRGEVTPEEEVCDGADNDCDGTVDESNAQDARTWYRDADGDGYGTDTETKRACDEPSGNWVDNARDCDDGAPSIKPGAEETCDGVDEDCDSDVDEGVAQACDNQQGVCQGAEVACQNGSFPDCTDSVYESHAQSNGDAWEALETQNWDDGKDNDCDGYADELFSELSVGGDQYCGRRRSDGSVICDGRSAFTSNVPSGSYEVVANSSRHACVADSAGNVTCWGDDQNGETSAPGRSFDALCAGDQISCGIASSSGTAYCWGVTSVSSGYGSNFDEVTCEFSIGCARDASTKELDCWDTPSGATPQPALAKFASGPYHLCGVLQSDGSIQCWGDHISYDKITSKSGPFQDVGTGLGFVCGIRENGELICWGDRDNFDFPKNVSGPFEKVYAGNNSACALHTNGRAECWYISGPCGSNRCDFP